MKHKNQTEPHHIGLLNDLPQQAITPETDLREMVRTYIVRRSLACMEKADERRQRATVSSDALANYRKEIRETVQDFYGDMPAGPDAKPPSPQPVSEFQHAGFRLENVLFETYPGWEVNATVYVPTEHQPPYPTVIVPVGHSGKQFESYQLPCQYFARAGYLAICFDPPGQRSEKRPGNDHFNDGVRDYLIGQTSSRYFISDAIRCIDYAATRNDVDMSHGVAMTGVSGGGKTTAFSQVLDDRIGVIGPCCCLASLTDIDIQQCYAGCPETHQFGRYAAGIDDVDLLCAAVPTPCLVMAGEGDEVYHIEDTRDLTDIVAGFYDAAGVPEKFNLSVDSGGHAYPLTQAQTFTRFMNQWLLDEPDRFTPDPADNDFEMRPYDELRCHPRTDVNMRTLATGEADQLAEERSHSPESVRAGARVIAQLDEDETLPEAEVGGPFQVWCHDWRSVMLRPEPDIELPATFLTTREDEPAPTILHIDDGGRHRLLYRKGPLAGTIRFLDRDRSAFNLLTVDLRGWGDTEPGMYPYEIAAYGSIDRYTAYATAALGDPIISMRIRDALAALQWLRNRPEVDKHRIVLTGSGVGAIVALHVGAISANLAGVITLDGLSSFRDLIEAEHYCWPADVFLPNALRHYDLPELASAIPAPVHLHNLRDAGGNKPNDEELKKWQESENTTLSHDDGDFSFAATVENMAESGSDYHRLREREPLFWSNPNRKKLTEFDGTLPFSETDIAEAEARWQRCAPLLARLFAELEDTGGVIESELIHAPSFAERILPPDSGDLFLKADHALPVAGSIKARGGIYAVLHFAEKVALQHDLLDSTEDDYRKLAIPEARQLFGEYDLRVASTGNLGLSIGIMGSALGFQVAVHMSEEAKEWKKKRLRQHGVMVVEHASDYTAACKVARAEAQEDSRTFFVDDENSVELFMGYACAVPRLKKQLKKEGIVVDQKHPIFFYLPCGVGGGPGGITFAARYVFGDAAHCFFVEPVDAPCMTLGMLSGRHSDVSIYSIGLGLNTDADGLAVSTPSRFIGELMEPLLDGCCTLRDRTMYRHLLDLYETENIEVEPSAAAGCGVPHLLCESDPGREYLHERGLSVHMHQATHIVWLTGGLFIPPEQHKEFRKIGITLTKQ